MAPSALAFPRVTAELPGAGMGRILKSLCMTHPCSTRSASEQEGVTDPSSPADVICRSDRPKMTRKNDSVTLLRKHKLWPASQARRVMTICLLLWLHKIFLKRSGAKV